MPSSNACWAPTTWATCRAVPSKRSALCATSAGGPRTGCPSSRGGPPAPPRRNEGKGPSDAADIVDQLPSILGHGVSTQGGILNVRTTSLEPPDDTGELIVELEGILHLSSLTGLGQITDEELRQ